MLPLGLPQLSVDPVLFLPLWLGTLRDHSGYAPNGTITGNLRWGQIGSVDGIAPNDGGSRIVIADYAAGRVAAASVFLSSRHGFKQASQNHVRRGSTANLQFNTTASQLTLYGGGVASNNVFSYGGAKTLAATVDAGPAIPEFYANGVSVGPGSVPITLGIAAADYWLLSSSFVPTLTPLDMVLIYPASLPVDEVAELDDYSQSVGTPRKQWPGGGADYPGRPPAQDGDPLYLDNIQTARVSLVDETSGQLSNTGYTIRSGTWRVKEDATTGERYIECITSGVLSRRSLQAYGTWRFKILSASGTASLIQFVSDEPVRAGLAPNAYFTTFGDSNGAFVFTGESGGGGLGVLTKSANGHIPISQVNELAITRGQLGEFTSYAKLGSNPWALVDSSVGGSNPVTRTQNPTSVHLTYWFGAGDRIYLDNHFSGVLAP